MVRPNVRGLHMAQVRIAIATEDGITSNVRLKDLRTLYVYEYDPEKTEFVFVEKRETGNSNNDTSVIDLSPAGTDTESHGGCGHGTGTRCQDDTFLKDLISKLADCEYLLLEKIGPRPARTLLREGIQTLEKGGDINESLLQLSAYVTKRNRVMTRINMDLH